MQLSLSLQGLERLSSSEPVVQAARRAWGAMAQLEVLVERPSSEPAKPYFMGHRRARAAGCSIQRRHRLLWGVLLFKDKALLTFSPLEHSGSSRVHLDLAGRLTYLPSTVIVAPTAYSMDRGVQEVGRALLLEEHLAVWVEAEAEAGVELGLPEAAALVAQGLQALQAPTEPLEQAQLQIVRAVVVAEAVEATAPRPVGTAPPAATAQPGT
jgi:hypothetical protein